MRWSFLLLAAWLVTTVCPVRGDESQLRDPRWWFARAEAELPGIRDPDERTLVASMVSSGMGHSTAPADLAKSLTERFAPQRAKFGSDADWRFSWFCGREYSEANCHREAIEALRRGQLLAEAIQEDKRRAAVTQEFDRELKEAITKAARAGEVVIALESIATMLPAPQRSSAREKIAVSTPKHDLQTAERATSAINPIETPAEWRLLLLLHWPQGGVRDFDRAIVQLVSDRPRMDELEIRTCYRALTFNIHALAPDAQPASLRGFEELLRKDASTHGTAKVRDDAAKCLTMLLLVRGRFTESLAVTDEDGNSVLRRNLQQRAIEWLVGQGRHEQALELSPAARTYIAAAQIKAGKLEQALATLEQFESRGSYNAGYASDLASRFAERGDWEGVARAVALVGDLPSKCHVLQRLAAIANQAEANTALAALLRSAREELKRVDVSQRKDATRALAIAYAKAGDGNSANRLAESCDDFDRAFVLLELARWQLEQKRLAEFRESLAALKQVLARNRLAEPAADESFDWNGARQIHFALQVARLHLQASERTEGAATIKRAFDTYGSTPGVMWRAEMYFELGSEDMRSQSLREIVDLAEIAPTALDRALIQLTGGFLAGKLARGEANDKTAD